MVLFLYFLMLKVINQTVHYYNQLLMQIQQIQQPTVLIFLNILTLVPVIKEVIGHIKVYNLFKITD